MPLPNVRQIEKWVVFMLLSYVYMVCRTFSFHSSFLNIKVFIFIFFQFYTSDCSPLFSIRQKDLHNGIYGTERFSFIAGKNVNEAMSVLAGR